MPTWGETLARRSIVKMITKTVGHADLDEAGTTQTVQFDATEAMNFIVVGWEVRLATPFTGGSVSAVDVTMGTAADPVALIAACDVLSAAVDGHASDLTIGEAPFKYFSGATTFDLDFTSTGDNLVNLTAGSATFVIHALEVL